MRLPVAWLVAAVLTGCVLKGPYPKQWGELAASAGDCPDVSGMFAETGDMSPEEVDKVGEAWRKHSLSAVLIGSDGERGPVSHLELDHPAEGVFRVVAWQGDEIVAEREFRRDRGDYTCVEGFLTFVGEYTCTSGNGVMACDRWEKHFRKSADGSLILRTNSRGFGTVYLIPAVVSMWNWYRFPPAQSASTRAD